MRVRGFILALVLTLAGCATREPEVSRGAEEEPAEGWITVMRVEAEPTPREIFVMEAGREVASVPNHGYATISRTPGSVALSLDWPDTPSVFENELEVELAEGERVYVTVARRVEVESYERLEAETRYETRETCVVVRLPEAFARSLMERLDERERSEWVWE